MGFGGLIKGLPGALGRGLKGIANWSEDGWPGSGKPGAEGMDYSQTNTGSPFPLVYGTRRIDQPIMKWKGNEDAIDVGGGAIRYHTDMLFGCGVPSWDTNAAPYNNWRATRPPRLRRVWYGDALSQRMSGVLGIPPVVPAGDYMDIAHGENCIINLPGSAVGNLLEFFDGRRTQSLSDGLNTLTLTAMSAAGVNMALVPAWRHQLLVGFTSFRPGSGIGFDPHVKPFGFEIESAGPQAIASGDYFHANPAWVFYDLLTRPVWGAGVDPARIDLSAFTNVATSLVTEELGISLVVYQRTPLRDLLQGILAHIAAVSFVDPATGKITLRLMRSSDASDYSATVDNLVGRPKLGHFGWQDTKNVARIHFVNQDINYRPDTAQDDRLGSSVGQSNRIRDFEETYGGCTSAAQAAMIASRDLSAVARPLIAGTVPLNREFYDLKPGQIITANWPVFDVVNKRLRVLDVNDGQLGKGTIEVEVIEDVVGDMSSSGTVIDTTPQVENMIPLHNRVFDEAPFWLCQRSFIEGKTPAVEQRMLGAAVLEGIANRIHTDDTRAVSGGSPGPLLADVPIRFAGAHAFVATNYARAAEPYDTDAGLTITTAGLTDRGLTVFATMLANLNAGLSALEVPDAIRSDGINIILVVTPGSTSGGEFMAFEDIVDNGGGSYTLVNVWRGLFDTVPVDIAAGAPVYWIGTVDLGSRAWQTTYTATGTTIPNKLAIDGSGGDPQDAVAIAERIERVPPLADFCASGYEASGIEGLPQTPAVNDTLKEVTNLDGALDFTGRGHRRDPGVILRGDETDAFDPDVTINLHAQKSGESELELDGYTDMPSMAQATGVLLGKAGHGDIDVIARTFDSNNGLEAWQAPRIAVSAPRYRDLLANGSFFSDLSGWTTEAGTPARFSGATSLQRVASGSYLGALAGNPTVSQIVDVSGYKAVGLDAMVTWYARSLSGSPSTSVTIRALDDADVELGNVASGSITPPTTSWRRHTVTLTDLPSGTAKIKVEVTLTAEPETPPTAQSIVERVRLQLGQFSSQLLSNPTFDSNFTSWTNVTNSFAIASPDYASDSGAAAQSARGGNFASSEIRQDVSIPAGYEFGTAVLELARWHDAGNGSAGDTGQVIIEARDGSGVLASTTGPAEDLSGAVSAGWVRRRYAVDVPAGALTIRVRLLATAAGAKSGAMFDDLSLRVHKHLDAPTTIDFDFGAPVRAHAPGTWQAFHLAYPELAIPIVWGGVDAKPSIQPSESLDVGAAYTGSGGLPGDLGIMRGYFQSFEERADDDLDCYVFDRAGSTTLVVTERLEGVYGKFSAADSFTVAVLLRSTELAWGGSTGLVGRRRDADGVGWGLQLDATGHAKAIFKGATSEISVVSSDVVADRSPRWVVMRVTGSTMKLYTKAGTAASSFGALGTTAIDDVSFRIGTDWISSTSFAGQVARVYIWDSALAEADIQAMIAEIGADPSGLVTTWTGSQPVWVPGTSNDDGATLVRCSAADIPIAYDATLDADGDGYGLALTLGNRNAIVTNDMTDNAHWGGVAGTTVTTGIVDPTGLPRGARIVQSTPGAFYTHTDMDVTDIGWWQTVVYLRSVGGPKSIDVQLVNSNGVVVDTQTLALTTSWQRFTTVHAWDGSTPTAHLRFVVTAGGTGTYEISHAIWSGGVNGPWSQESYPIAFQDAGVTIGDTYAVRAATLPLELNYEGEIEVQGRMFASPDTSGGGFNPTSNYALAQIDNNSDEHNKRQLIIDTGDGVIPQFEAYVFDSTGAAGGAAGVVSTSPVASWKARCRWNTLFIPDAGSQDKQRGCAVTVGGVSSYNYQTNAFTVDSVQNTRVRIGGNDGFGSRSPMAVIRRVVVRSREQKMTGE